MAPIKFEEQIKDKLEQRTVSPSTDAWSKLSQQLDAEDNFNKKSRFWWFGIAASVAILIMISVSYFNNETGSEKIENSIVKDNVEDVITPKEESISIKDKFINLEKQEVAVEQNNSETQQLNEGKNRVASQDKNNLIKKTAINTKKTVVAKTQIKQSTKEQKKELQSKENLIKVPEVEFNSVIAEVQKAKNTVTDQEIDSLLKVANKELFMDKVLKKKSDVVDAGALLQDVEDEMGQSFRTRIYETLKSGLKEVKKAVAQRND